MRHAAVTLAEQLRSLVAAGRSWDVLICSDMLNLAEFRGLCPASLARTAAVVYFHENQLTYPVRVPDERDFHFAFTNFTTCLAADAVWFNSAFHRDAFLAALPDWLKRMPDHQSLDQVELIKSKSARQPPGVEDFPNRGPRQPGPLRIVWAARWEHDKNPEGFFAAMEQLAGRGIDFRLCVLGEQFREVPPVFAECRRRLSPHIDRWGYLPSRDEYRDALLAADVFVSTAHHEFFGIAAVEAMAAGCYPLLPRRLAYPELLSEVEPQWADRFLYDGDVPQLVEKLVRLNERIRDGGDWAPERAAIRGAAARFSWRRRVVELDRALQEFIDC